MGFLIVMLTFPVAVFPSKGSMLGASVIAACIFVAIGTAAHVWDFRHLDRSMFNWMVGALLSALFAWLRGFFY